jgi:hypothetical protein
VWVQRTKRDEPCTKRDGAGRFHHVTQNGVQFETYESFISGIFHLIFSGRSKPRITETADTGVLPYSISCYLHEDQNLLKLPTPHKTLSRPGLKHI